jgi:hypothetical protein
MRLRGYLPVEGVGNVYCRPEIASGGGSKMARGSYFRKTGARRELATFSQQLSVEADAPVQMGAI